MNPATPPPSHARFQIRSALWLLGLLSFYVPPEWNGEQPVWIAQGNLVTDAELGERLGASPRTIASWRLRLRKAGIIGWHVAPGRGRTFWLNALNRIQPIEQTPAAESRAMNQEALAVMPMASRFVQ